MASFTEIRPTPVIHGYVTQPLHNLRTRVWTTEEDAAIMRAWQESDKKRIKWSAVAATVGVDRSPRDCCRRWYNHLRFTINQDEIPCTSSKARSDKIDNVIKLNIREIGLASKQEQEEDAHIASKTELSSAQYVRAPAWTAAEYEIIIRAWQEARASKTYMPWDDVVAQMGTGRTVAACRRHWDRHVKYQALGIEKTERFKPSNKKLLKQAKIEKIYKQRLNNERIQEFNDPLKEPPPQGLLTLDGRTAENGPIRVADVGGGEVFGCLQQTFIHSDVQDSGIKSSCDNSIVEQMCKEYGYTYEDMAEYFV